MNVGTAIDLGILQIIIIQFNIDLQKQYMSRFIVLKITVHQLSFMYSMIVPKPVIPKINTLHKITLLIQAHWQVNTLILSKIAYSMNRLHRSFILLSGLLITSKHLPKVSSYITLSIKLPGKQKSCHKLGVIAKSCIGYAVCVYVDVHTSSNVLQCVLQYDTFFSNKMPDFSITNAYPNLVYF